MNFIEAVKLAREGKKVCRQGTEEFALKFYDEIDGCFSLHTSLEDVQATDWMVVGWEEKKGRYSTEMKNYLKKLIDTDDIEELKAALARATNCLNTNL